MSPFQSQWSVLERSPAAAPESSSHPCFTFLTCNSEHGEKSEQTEGQQQREALQSTLYLNTPLIYLSMH